MAGDFTGAHRDRLARIRPLGAYPSRWGYWPAVLGLFAFVWLELASTALDSFSAMPQWRNFVDRHGAPVAFNTIGLVVFASVVAVTFWAAARAPAASTSTGGASCPG